MKKIDLGDGITPFEIFFNLTSTILCFLEVCRESVPEEGLEISFERI
jgi:hypothetical protein